MNKVKEAAQKTAKFLKRNIYYVLIIVCIGAIAAMIAITVTTRNNAELPDDSPSVEAPTDPQPNTPVVGPDDNNDEPQEEPKNEPTAIVFTTPVNGATVGTGYAADTIVWSNTLNQHQAHFAVDFMAAEGTDVLAAYAGVVESVTEDMLNGITVTVDHGNGLKTVYGSLTDLKVTQGASLTAGAVIGKVSTSMLSECADGAHLHFSVMQDGSYIDPYTYLVVADK